MINKYFHYELLIDNGFIYYKYIFKYSIITSMLVKY